MLKTFFTAAMITTSLAWSHGDHISPTTPVADVPMKAHLTYKNKTLHLHVQFAKTPQIGTETFLTIETRSGADHSLVAIDDSIEVALWMPDMGHGSAPTQIDHAVDNEGTIIPGKYSVRKMYFVMGGLWDVQITLTDKNGNQETHQFSLTLADDDQH